MLSQEENELITRVGPGTPMGNLFREYWLPAMLSEELPAADSDPVRVLMLGEQLIAFRDSNARSACSRTTAPIAAPRSSSAATKKLASAASTTAGSSTPKATASTCPTSPPKATSAPRSKPSPTRPRSAAGSSGPILARAQRRRRYPTWKATCCRARPPGRTSRTANWFQILEGHIDTAHVSFLHYGGVKPEDVPPGSFSEYQLRERSAHFEVIDTDGGAAYAANRPATDGQTYWRIAQWIFPSFSMAPPGVLGLGKRNACEVPLDDHHTITYQMSVSRGRPGVGPSQNVNPIPLRPTTTDWYGRFHTTVQPSNDFLIDREAQRRNEGTSGFTGIQGIAMQDAAVTSSMGPIYDRRKEHLGTSDAMVIRVRRRVIAAIKAHMQNGTVPPGVDDPAAYRVRSGGVLLPEGADWVEATRELRKAFVDHPELDPALNGPL